MKESPSCMLALLYLLSLKGEGLPASPASKSSFFSLLFFGIRVGGMYAKPKPPKNAKNRVFIPSWGDGTR